MGPADEVNVVSEIVLSEDLIVGSRLIRREKKNNRDAAILSAQRLCCKSLERFPE
jgi:hypothetical protein